jgi:flagella basal body P-ring formation protein FlgA
MIALRAPALLVALALAGALCAPVGVRASVGSSETMQIVAGARLTALADRIAHGLGDGPDRAVSPAFTIADQRVPNGAVTVEPGGAPYVSPTYVGVPVAIRIDGTVVRTVVAGFRVLTYVETAVAAHDLAPGTLISAEDVTLTRVAATGRPAVGRDVLFGRRLNLAIAKGVPLYVEETSPDRVVRAGQAAILVIHDGPVSLMADVIARTGGAIGDTVTVVNLQTQRAVAGIVTGPNRVELTLPGGE